MHYDTKEFITSSTEAALNCKSVKRRTISNTVLEQQNLGTNPNKVKRLVLSTGKMAIDLAEKSKVVSMRTPR